MSLFPCAVKGLGSSTLAQLQDVSQGLIRDYEVLYK